MCRNGGIQFEETDDRMREGEQQQSPTDRDNQRDCQVVGCKVPGFFRLLRPDALRNADLRTYFVQIGDGTRHPRQNTDSSDCCHRFAAQTSHPSHIGDAIRHLYKRGPHYGKCQVKQLLLDRSFRQILCPLHVRFVFGCKDTNNKINRLKPFNLSLQVPIVPQSRA